MPLSWFQTLKQKRNTELRTGDGEIDYSEVYEMLVGTLDPNADIDKLNHKVRVKGKPTLGNVKNIVIGIRNPQGESSKGERSAEVWVTNFVCRISITKRIGQLMPDYGKISRCGDDQFCR